MTRARGPLVTALVVCLLAPLATAQTPDGLGAFVNKAAADIAASPLQVPQFKGATLDTVEDLGKSNGAARYLCWLKTDPNRVGYIAVAADGKSFQVLAFSATVQSPAYLVKALTAAELPQKPLNLARVRRRSSITRVPLVAATRTRAGSGPFQISELAASLSAMLNYWQDQRDVLFFGHVGFGEGFQPDSEYKRRFKENPNIAQELDDPNWQSFRKERTAALIRTNFQWGQTPEEMLASKVRARDMVKPMIRRRLLDPLNAYERINILQEERAAIDGMTAVDISIRMRDAILLQMDYLDPDTEHLQQDLEFFFRTRGRVAQLNIQPFQKVQPDLLPVVIMGPEHEAGVVLGYVDIGGERFASVLFPETAMPTVASLAQRQREMRTALGLSAELNPTEGEEFDKAVAKARKAEEEKRKTAQQKGIRYSPPEKEPGQALKESAERMKAAREASPVALDRFSVSPLNAEHGVHLIRCSALASWQTLYIAKIEVGPNWGKTATK